MGVALLVSILAVNFPHTLETAWWAFFSLIGSFSFVFGSLIKDVCESLTLILLIRPFDLGDRIVVGGQRLLVVELNMLTTTFLNGYNELVWLRNSQIFTDAAGVCNLSRSEHAECAIELDILAE